MRINWWQNILRALGFSNPRKRQPWVRSRLRLEPLEDRLAPATNISFSAATHTLTVTVGAANETATLSVDGTLLSVNSDVGGTTSDGGLGFLANTAAGTANKGDILAANDVRLIFIVGAAGTQTLVFAGGTFTGTTVSDGGVVGNDIENVQFTTAASTFANVSPGALLPSSLNVVATGAITINQNIVTGNVLALDTNGADTPTSGSINLTAGTGITGSGRLITGDATLDGPIAAGADAVTSGSINLSVTGAGDIGLSASHALTIGNRLRTGAAGAADVAVGGNISLIADRVNNGTPGSALSVLQPNAVVGFASATPGRLNVTTDGGAGAAGEIQVTTDTGSLDIGTLNTADGTAQTVNLTATGTAGIGMGGGGPSNLDTDAVTMNAGGAINLGNALTLGSLSATTPTITVGATIDASASVDLSVNTANINAVVTAATAASVRQLTDARRIDLGSEANNATRLALTAAEVDRLHAPTVNIGNANSGAIDVAGAVAPTAITTLNLTTNGNISDGTAGAGGNLITVANLNLAANGTIDVNFNANNVTATSSGNQFLQETDTVSIDAGGLSALSNIISLGGGTFSLSGAALLNDASTLDVRLGAVFRLNGFAETVGGLSGSGSVRNGSATAVVFTVDQAAGSLIFEGVLGGSGANDNNFAFTKDGAGTLALGGTNTYTGATTIDAGTLLVNGSLASASTVAVNNDATLGGVGTINGNVNLNNSSHLAPGITSGDTTSVIIAGNVTFSATTNFDVGIDGTAANQFDALDSTGDVSLAGATLNLSGAYVPQLKDSFKIVTTSGNKNITGTFNGLPDGTLIPFNGQTLKITYAASGKEVKLAFDDNPVVPGVTGNAGNDSFTVTLDPGNTNFLLVKDGGGATVFSRNVNGIETLTINGGGGDDTVTIDYTVGFFKTPVIFHGDGQTTSPNGDKLVVKGGSFGRAVHTFTAADAGNIIYDVDGDLSSTNDQGTITYDGLEPVDMTGSTIDNLVFNLPGTDDQAILEDDGTPANTFSQIRSQNATPTFETTTFANTVTSVTVNMGGDTGALTVASMPDFTKTLIVNGQAGDDTVSLTGTNTFAALTVNVTTSITNTATANVTVTGNASFTAATTTLGTVSGDNLTFGSVSLGGTTATVSEDDGATFANVTVGSVSYTANGAIDDGTTGDVSVTGAASLTATSNTITLGNDGGNDTNFGSVTLSGTTVSVSEDSAATFDNISATTFTYTANGAIDDGTDGDVSVTGAASITATSNTITLGNDAGNDTNFGSISLAGSSANVSEDSAATFDNVSPSALTYTANGAIDDGSDGDINVSGAASLTATSNTITLGNNAGNTTNFGSIGLSGTTVSVSEDTGATFDTVDVDALSYTANGAIGDGANGDVAVAGATSLTATANTITLGNDAGNDTAFGSLNFGGTTINISEDGDMVLAGTSSGSGVTLASSGTITQSGVGTSFTGAAISLTAPNGIGTGTQSLQFDGTSLTTNSSGNNGAQFLQEPTSITVTSMTAGNATITLTGGTFLVNGTVSSDVDVNAGTLGGDGGSITGTVDVNSGAILAPGASPGILTVNGPVNFNAGSNFSVEINGTLAGTEHDLLNVTGANDVTIDPTATLTITGTGATAAGDAFRLINMTGTGAITGAFGGRAEGSTVILGGNTHFFSYVGGPGANDFILARQGAVTRLGSGSADEFELRRITSGSIDSLQLLLGGAIVDARPIASVDSWTINAGGGDDSLNVNYGASGGFFNKPVTFNGEGPGSSPGDSLTITDGTFHTVTSNYTTASSGNIQLDPDGPGGVSAAIVNYTGLEPVLINTGSMANIIFNLPAGVDIANLEDAPAAGQSRLRSSPTTFEITTFDNPTTSLTVNLTGGDTINVTALDSAFSAAVNLIGDGSADTFNVTGVTLTDPLTINGGAGVNTATIGTTSITGATGTGLTVQNLSTLSITGGSFSTNTGNGISLNTITTSASVTGTTLSDNGADGLNAVSVNALSLGSVTATGNTGDGLDATLTGANSITSSNFNDNGRGMLFGGAGTLSVTGSQFNDNTNTTDNGGGISISPGAGNVTITSTTIAGNSVAGVGTGGGIFVPAGYANTLTLTGVTIGGATAANGNSAAAGGGIALAGGTVKFDGAVSTIGFNSATTNGGGIAISGGTLTVAPTSAGVVFENNSAVSGGAVSFLGGTGHTILNTTINNNTASTGAGLNLGAGFGGTVKATNTTISTNTGDGITVAGGTLTLNFTTTALNSGAGLRNTAAAANVVLQNALFSLNTGGDYLGALTTVGNNLFQSAAGITSVLNPITDLPNRPARLAPLALYNGTTRTHALLPGSFALDLGVAIAGVTTDQRGVARPQNTVVDVGAFESRGFTVERIAVPDGAGTGETPAGDTAFRGLVSRTFRNADGTTPIQFAVRVTAAAADGLTDLTGGVVRFVGPNVAIVPGVASTNLAIIALTFSGGQNTAQTALTANNISSAPGAAGIYDTFATVKPNPTFASPGVNSTKWKLFNQRVVTFFYNIPTGNASAAFPINAQSGNVTLFRSPNGTESSVVTITMRDQDNRTVVITGETVALSLFKGVTPVNISSASAVPGNPAITLTGPTIRTTTVAGTAFVQDISIFQSAFKTPYVFRALYVNGDAVLSKGIGLTGFFRVLPQFFDIQGGLFAGAGQTAFILNLTESSRGTIRLLNIVSGDNGLGTNQFRVQAFDFVSPGVATPALAYDGPAFLTFEVNASLGAQTDFFKANVPTLTPTNLVGGVLLLSNLTVTASVLSDGFTISAALGILPDQFLSPTPPTLAALLPPTSPFTPPQYLAPTIFVNNGVLDETFFIKKFSRINLGRLRSR